MKPVIFGLALCLGASPALAAAKGAPLGCAAFIQDFPAAAHGYRTSFERPLTITRGFGGDEPGVDIRTLASDTEVEGTLKCRGDAFLRFEMRIKAPPKEKVSSDLDAFARAALAAVFHWDPPKTEQVVRALDADAAEYLRASEQRGDLYISGKVEYHGPEAIDLGALWTPNDHAFVVAKQTGE